MARINPREGLNRAIIETIRELLDAADLTPTEAARKAGVPTSNVHRVVNFERAISLADMSALASVFGLRGSELLGRAETRMELWK